MNVSEYMKLFDALDEKDRLLVERLCEELVDLEKQMAEYKKYPFISVNPRNPAFQKKTPAAALYKDALSSYMNGVRILSSFLHRVDESAENELMRKLDEFVKD